MYNIFKSVIQSKNYELKDILIKIDTLWVQGSITDEQRLELIADAQENAKMENSIDIMNKLFELERRVSALESASKENNGNTEPTEYQEYETGKWYFNGDIIIFEGLIYKCIAPDGVVCTWSPKDYPAYWEIVHETE